MVLLPKHTLYLLKTIWIHLIVIFHVRQLVIIINLLSHNQTTKVLQLPCLAILISGLVTMYHKGFLIMEMGTVEIEINPHLGEVVNFHLLTPIQGAGGG